MAFTGEYEYKEDGIDRIIDERGNVAIIMREVRWKKDNDYKLDIRKYNYTDEGERYSKGISFLTEDGPDELVKILLEEGYGKPDEIAEAIKSRDDIMKAFAEIKDGDDLYDPREMIS